MTEEEILFIIDRYKFKYGYAIVIDRSKEPPFVFNRIGFDQTKSITLETPASLYKSKKRYHVVDLLLKCTACCCKNCNKDLPLGRLDFFDSEDYYGNSSYTREFATKLRDDGCKVCGTCMSHMFGDKVPPKPRD